MRFKIDDLIIPASDTSVSGFVYNDVKDWYSGPPRKTVLRPKPTSSGDFYVTNVNYESLVVTVSGVYVGRNPAATVAAKARLARCR